MRTVLGILIVGIMACCTAAATPFVHGPYSGAPSDDSVVISWLASELGATRVEYGPRSEYEASGAFSSWVSTALPAEDTTPATEHVTLSGLDANTAFSYRVVLEADDGDVASSVGYFVTEPPSGDTINFAVIADTQWQWEGENRLESVANAVAADDMPFDFILHAGDIVESPSSFYWDDWFASFDSMLKRAPFIPVLGNHERNDRSYYEQFELPPGAGKNDERWWALHWGDIVVVGLDTNVRTPAEYVAQQEWARLHLSGPESHKFVMFHHPVLSSDAFHGSGYSYDVIYHPIFVETGVDMVINGHAHNYERIQRDGVIYLIVGGGGAVPRELADSLVDGSVIAVEGYNFYLRVTAATDGITVDTVSVARADEESFQLTDGRLLDSFVLATEASAEPVALPQGITERFPTWIFIVLGAVVVTTLALLLRKLRR